MGTDFKAAIERDQWRCFRCGIAIGRTWLGYSAHHRRLRSAGGTDTPENLIMLCGSGTTGCHGWVHEHRMEAGENGWIVSRFGTGPEDIPVRHHELGMVYLAADGRVITMAEADASAAADDYLREEGD